MLDLVKADKQAGKCVGVMTVEEGAGVFQGVADVVVTCGHATNLSSVAQVQDTLADSSMTHRIALGSQESPIV